MKGLFRLLKYVREYKKDTILTWVGVVLESICEVLVVFIMQYLVDSIEKGDNADIVKYALIMIGLALLAALTGILAGYFCSSASAGFGKNLREEMFTRIQKYSFANIDKFSTASIVTRTTTDVTNAQSSFQAIIRAVIRAPLMMVAGIVMCFITAPKVAWIFLAICPFSLIILIVIAKSVHPTFKKVFEKYDDLNKVVEEDVSAIRVVKSFNHEEEEVKKFKKVSDFIYKNFVKAERIVAFNGPVLNLSIYLCIILVSYFGSRLIVSSNGTEMSAGSLTSLISFIMLIMMSLMMVTMVYVILMVGRNSIERINEILDEVPDIVSPKDGVTEVKNGDIEFKDVTFAYNRGKAVAHNLNISIKSGQMIGVVGGTGSGKSSIIRLIGRLYDVSEGSVEVGGIDVRKYDLKALRDACAVVLQKNTLFSGTVRSNLMWGNENATEAELMAACDIAQVTPFLKDLPGGLDAPIEQGGTNVSGGQKQRLCIARALLKNPKVLLLDDSTSACDTHTDSLIRKGLQETKKDVTKVIVAQRILSVKDCDQILVMDNGVVVDHGTADELLKRCEIFKELYTSQLGGDFDAKN